MDKSGLAGAILEQGKNLGKASSDQMAQFVKAASSQVTGSYDASRTSSDSAPTSLEALAKQASDDPLQNQKSDTQQQGAPQNPQQASQADVQKEEQLKAVRDKLALEQHKTTYYEPTFNPPQKQEEAVTEKLEREEQEEKMKLMEEEKKKPQPIALQRAQNRAEMNRGASG